MSTIVQVCLVVVTIAVVFLACVAARLMLQIEATTKRFEVGLGLLERSLEDSRQTSQKIRELVGMLEQIAHSAHSGLARIKGVAEHATSMSEAVLDQLERPVRDVAAVLDGLRSGVQALASRWTDEPESMDQANGGQHHV